VILACSSAKQSYEPYLNSLALTVPEISGEPKIVPNYSNTNKMAAIAGRRYVLPAGNRCYFVLLDNDKSCPTADLSNIGHPSAPAYSTSELLNTPQAGNFVGNGTNPYS